MPPLSSLAIIRWLLVVLVDTGVHSFRYSSLLCLTRFQGYQRTTLSSSLRLSSLLLRNQPQAAQHESDLRKNNGKKDAVLKQKLELLQPIRRELQVRPNNFVVDETEKIIRNVDGNSVTTKSVHHNRKPRGYWKSVSNIDRELRDQWLEAIGASNRTLNDDSSSASRNDNPATELHSLLHPPPIPNDALLSYWKRNDLRYAIQNYGGRTNLAEALREHYRAAAAATTSSGHQQVPTTNDCYIVPGKWKEMTGHHNNHPQGVPHPLVSLVLEHDPLLRPDRAPVSRGQKQRLRSRRYGMSETDIESWIHDDVGRWRHVNNYRDQQTNNPRKRAGRGFWSRDRTAEVLSDYLGWRKRTKGIPSVWMPRPSELEHGGGDGDNHDISSTEEASVDERFGFLRNAIARSYGATRGSGFGPLPPTGLGGVDRLCCEMGLVPYHEWRYFEGMHDLMVSLKGHIDSEHLRELKEQPRQADDDGSEESGLAGRSSGTPDYGVFPRGYSSWRKSEPRLRRLFYLVQNYGGRDLVAGRLGMAPSLAQQRRMQRHREQPPAENNGDDDDDDPRELPYPSWGPFDLEFGISLMEYIRLDQLRREPLRRRINDAATAATTAAGIPNEWTRVNRIGMPTRKELMSKSPASPASLPVVRSGIQRDHRGEGDNDESWGDYLDRKIIDCGGYENVARRLGLEW